MAPFARFTAAFCSSTLNKGNTVPTPINTNTHRPHYLQYLHQSPYPTTRLRLSDAGLEIRDWEEGEGTSIMHILQSVESGFNPEGPLEIDCGSEALIRESYNEDGACMLIAQMKSDGNGDNDTSGAEVIVGTAALIVGTPVTYLKSGASISTPSITGAVRRVCAVTDNNDNDKGNANNNDDAFILQNLLMKIESRAAEAGVDELIVLAYPATARHRPNADLLERIGYTKLPANLDGVDVEQYGKTVDVHLGDKEEDSIAVAGRESESTRVNGALQNATIAVSFLGAIALALFGVATFMGLELIPSSDGNRVLKYPAPSGRSTLSRTRRISKEIDDVKIYGQDYGILPSD